MTQENYQYFDLQVNGYAGIDFNSISLTDEQLVHACNKLREDNVEGILATLITDDFHNMILKIKNLTSLIENNNFISSIIKGIHIEGPFINPKEGYRGAHPDENIIRANLKYTKEILDSGAGFIKLFTLAPEMDNNYNVIRYLSENNVVVSAGHTDASMDQLIGAIDNGLKLFTHLGNGSPPQLPRHDNIVNRVLSLADKLKICFIVDGIHIPIFVVKNYLKAAGCNNSIIVTDSMAGASAPPGRYSVSHIQVDVGNDRIVREAGKENLAGSAITMKESEILIKNKMNINNTELKKIFSENAKRVLNI
jgi:N-acetylglucosamine-6-phosphate deacetylase